MRKLLSLAICLCLLFSLLPGTAQAIGSDAKIDSIIAETKRVYNYSLSSAGKDSFQGFCGLMVSHQLYHMGINTSIETYDGNKQYDAYAQKEQTSGGYYPIAYPADLYTLAEALNAITRYGTRDAYNILVGFEWTNTEAGAIYGHACVINAIIDGTVYMTESFYTSLAGAEGNVIKCSIEELDAYFASWMVFEGVIHFGSGIYTDSCQSYETDIFVRTRFASTLRSQPCFVNDNDCRQLRDLQAGELLHVLGVYRNDLGETYYQIEENGQVGYVMANATVFVQANPENLTLQNHSIPVGVPQGRALRLSGQITAERGEIGVVVATITDTTGNMVRQVALDSGKAVFDLSQLELELETLEKGTYEISIHADSRFVTCQGPQLDMVILETCLYQNILQIGKFTGITHKGRAQTNQAPLDGFVRQNRCWYVYENGKPVEGWFTYLGIQYYAFEDGSVATGWQVIDEKVRYFTDNGCLHTGLLVASDSTQYTFEDGIVIDSVIMSSESPEK